MKEINHIAFIMDGNGRWATARHLPRSAGHRKGVESLKKVINACMKNGVKEISLYAFSSENWKRPKEELNSLFNLLREFFKRDLKSECIKPFKLRIMGDISAFPLDLREGIEKCLSDTSDIEGFVINIGLNYGGRGEIVRAFNRAIEAGETTLTEETLDKYLDTVGMHDPDIIVRTAGEKRVSNFMLYQLAYSEFIFLDKTWPEMDESDIDYVIHEYATRHRRFGGVEDK